MAIDSHYIPLFSIETVILDKDTGAPLSGGQVTFEEDNQRGTFKPVYQITGTSPNYSYTQLPNPMTLSSIGTFEDSMGNPVVPYCFPYDGNLNPDYYYVRVESALGVFQFDREAVPFIPNSGISPGSASSFVNELSNPQFAEVFFESPTVITFNAVSNHVTSIAPDWDLVVTSPAVGSVTLSIITPTGALNEPTNPGTILRINSGGLTSLLLRQRITGSPNLWGSGYLSGTFVARTGAGTSTVLDLYYSQSNGVIVNKLIASGTLDGSGSYAAHPGSVFIDVSTSADSYPGAYIDIFFDIPTSTLIDITSVMVAFTGNASVNSIVYEQQSNERQLDQLFHYYKTGLDIKPVSSYLVGWDFPFNPAQFYGDVVTTKAVGANKSFYAWDQTIIFQTVNSGISVARTTEDNGISITAALAGKFAIIQYLSAKQARDVFLTMFLEGASVSIQADSNIATPMTLSLWWTANGALPNLNTNDSLVTGLDANGYPTVVAGWTEITRNPAYSNQFSTIGSGDIGIFGFENFDDQTPYAGAGTFFAIVIGTSALAMNTVVEFNAISLVPGSVPTSPAPQAPDEVLRQCQYYYEKSYLPSVVAGTNTTVGSVVAFQNSELTTAVNGAAHFYQDIISLKFKQVKISASAVISIYSLAGTNTKITAFLNGLDSVSASKTATGEVVLSTYWTVTGQSIDSVYYVPITSQLGANLLTINTTLAASFIGTTAWVAYQYVIDARLGVV